MNAIRRLQGCLALILAVLLAACAPASSPTPTAIVSTFPTAEPTVAPIKIKAGVPPNLSNAAFFIAQDEGYFTEQGLDVEFVSIASTSKSVPLLVSGDVDLLAGSIAVAGLNAIVKGTNLKIVADKGHYEPGKCASRAYVVRRGFIEQHPPTDLSSLKGAKINVNPAAYSGFELESLLARAGLTLNDVEISNLDTSVESEAIANGAIDMASALEPQLTQDVEAGRVDLWMTGDKSSPGKQVAYVMFGPTILDKNTEAGKRFMVAYLKAVKQYNEGATERNLDIVAKYTKSDRNILKKACWQYIAENGQVDTKSIVDFQTWAVQKKLMDSAATVDQFWDPSYITYAAQVLSSSK